MSLHCMQRQINRDLGVKIKEVDALCKNPKFHRQNFVKRYGYHTKCYCGYEKKKTGIYTHEGYLLQLQRNREEHREFCKSPMFFMSHTHHATEIDSSFVVSTTDHIGSGTTWTEESGWRIDETSFTGSKTYLLVVTAQFNLQTSTSNLRAEVRPTANNSGFGDSEISLVSSSSIGYRNNYSWFDVYTQPSTAVDIAVQHRSTGSSWNPRTKYVTIFAMNLSDDLTENTDWYRSENTTTTVHSTSWSTSNNASVSFTPPASSNWLVMGIGLVAVDSTSLNHEGRITSTGTFNENVPSYSREGEYTYEEYIGVLFRVFTGLGATTQTFTYESRDDASGTQNDRLNNMIFALNLDKFDQWDSEWTEAEITPSTTDFATEVMDLAITPSVTGNVWFMGQVIHDEGGIGKYHNLRSQVDGTDKPSGQTTDVFIVNYPHDSTDEVPFICQYYESMSNALHDIEFDASLDASGDGVLEDRSCFAVTMELAGAGSSEVSKTYSLDSVFEKLNKASNYSLTSVFEKFGKASNYSLDSAFEKLNKASNYSADSVFKKLGKAVNYSLDVVFGSSPSTNYDVDTVFEKLNKAKTYALDTVFGIKDKASTYSLSSVFKKLAKSADYSLDSVFKKLNKSATYSTDTVFKQVNKAVNYSLDVVFGMGTMTSSYDLDTVFKKLNKAKTYTLDTVFGFHDIASNYSLTTVFKKLGKSANYSLTSVFKKLGKSSTYSLDSVFKKLDKSSSYSTDSVFKKLNKIANYSLDVVFGMGTVSANYGLDTVFEKLNKAKTYSLDSVFQIKDKASTYSLSSVFKKLNKASTYNLTSVFKKLNKTGNYDLTSVFEELGKQKTYNVDSVFEQVNKSSTYLLDVVFTDPISDLAKRQTTTVVLRENTNRVNIILKNTGRTTVKRENTNRTIIKSRKVI